MLEIIGDKQLYQWDTGRTAKVTVECNELHFSNLKFGKALVVDVVDRVVEIPDEILMSGEDVCAWAFVRTAENGHTKQEQILTVEKRARPSDYVYTPTEIMTIEKAVEKALQEAKDSGDFKGDKGDRGDQGMQGEKGDKGDRGETGQSGDDYVLTEADKTEIADIVLQSFVDVSEVGQ